MQAACQFTAGNRHGTCKARRVPRDRRQPLQAERCGARTVGVVNHSLGSNSCCQQLSLPTVACRVSVAVQRPLKDACHKTSANQQPGTTGRLGTNGASRQQTPLKTVTGPARELGPASIVFIYSTSSLYSFLGSLLSNILSFLRFRVLMPSIRCHSGWSHAALRH
jgi:hypothetical protein